MTTPNIGLLRKAVEWVEEQDALAKRGEKSEWEQIAWFIPSGTRVPTFAAPQTCGSACCVAGYIATQTGAAWVDSDAVISPESGEVVSAHDYAEERLGIDPLGSDILFHSDNTAEDIRRIAEQLAGERL
ncbi:MAG: hypothetical protein ACRDQA_02845 [Nocardioidaceae bacterium]